MEKKNKKTNNKNIMKAVKISTIILLIILVSIIGFLGIIWALTERIMGNTVSGWTSMICVVAFMGGVQLICTEIIGEYVGKVYLETKHRPRYIISDRTYEVGDKIDGK